MRLVSLVSFPLHLKPKGIPTQIIGSGMLTAYPTRDDTLTVSQQIMSVLSGGFC